MTWNMCSETVNGEPCKNRARYRNGTKCCTCFNRAAKAKNPEAAAKIYKNYFNNNREKCKEKQRRYYYKNQDSEKARAWLYRYNNPDKVKAYAENIANPRRRAKIQAKNTLHSEGTSPGSCASGAGTEPQVRTRAS